LQSKDVELITLEVVMLRNKIPEVEFDPRNEEHRRAYLTLELTGRKDPNFRFYVDDVNYADGLTMMRVALAKWACRNLEVHKKDSTSNVEYISTVSRKK
jgi:hypothetical protein